MSPALEMRDYSFRYTEDGPDILKNCCLSLRHGEFMVLCGLSGEGKTTLLSSLAGIIPNHTPGLRQGDILVDGESIRDKKIAEVCGQVGCVLQNADSQIFHSRVEDEIAFGCENMCLPVGEITMRIEDSCRIMELSPDAATRTLSGGQKQRLVTACTLAMGQKILLLDEPLANLDGEGATLVLQTLRDLCSRGYAVLLAEHRLDMVLPYADTVVSLEGGRLVSLSRESAHNRVLRPIEDACRGNAAKPAACFDVNSMSYNAGGRPILTELDFSLREGERVVILGENGCGKTTLLRLLARLIKPTGGAIEQNMGKFRSKRDWFKAVGYVYQDPGYQLFMPTVAEEVAFGAAPGAAEGCMRRFDLEALGARHPHSLSEGQKRRLSIAAICATNPRVLLLDEPTVGQDYDNLRRIVNAVNAQHEETGNTMVTVTHDYRCAAALADRVLWFEKGRLYRDGGKELVEEYFGRTRDPDWEQRVG